MKIGDRVQCRITQVLDSGALCDICQCDKQGFIDIFSFPKKRSQLGREVIPDINALQKDDYIIGEITNIYSNDVDFDIAFVKKQLCFYDV